MFVGFRTLEHATYICPCEKHGSVLFCLSQNISQKGRKRLKMSKVYKHRGCRHTHVTHRVVRTVLSSHKRNAGMTGKVEKVIACVARRQGTEGRTKVR